MTEVANFTDRDIDMMARILLAEAGDQGSLEMQAVAHVINTRYRAGYAKSIYDMINQPGQFGPVATRQKYLRNIDPQSKDYQEAKQIALDAISGKSIDPTGGATHFLAPNIMNYRISRGRGR
jgi:spore germination cell wall hydrolase CwlJ-like protein